VFVSRYVPFFGTERQAYYEAAPLAELAFRTNRSAMRLDDLPANIEADARAPLIMRGNPVEALKDEHEILGRYA
jgi:hypothetical protein